MSLNSPGLSDSTTEHMWAWGRWQRGVVVPCALGCWPGFAIQQPLRGRICAIAKPVASGIFFVTTPVPQEKGQIWTRALSPSLGTTPRPPWLRPNPEQTETFYFTQKPRILH